MLEVKQADGPSSTQKPTKNAAHTRRATLLNKQQTNGYKLDCNNLDGGSGQTFELFFHKHYFYNSAGRPCRPTATQVERVAGRNLAKKEAPLPGATLQNNKLCVY
jgi:hypothetical protein